MIVGVTDCPRVFILFYSPSASAYPYESIDGQDGRKRSVSAASESSESFVVFSLSFSSANLSLVV
jgi:hypothetical protein